MDLAAGALLRAAFLATTLHTPGRGAVPTTDVDHAVAVRGAAAALKTHALCAPFADPSFRYPPTAALLAAPALALRHRGAAKALYCLADLAIAALSPPGLPRLAWALNPVAAALAARGSADAVTGVLVLLSLRRVKRARRETQDVRRAYSAAALAGAALGAAAFHRLVPTMHALPFTLHLLHSRRRGVALAFTFLAAAGLTGGSLTLATLATCGRPYWASAVAHHAARVDGRHSFAPAFLAAHLAGGTGGQPLQRLNTLLQAFTALAAGFYDAWGGAASPGAAAALQALALVTLNRVATAQYWLWWACLLPAAAGFEWPGRLDGARARRLGAAACGWAAGQAAWLWCADRLERRGGGVAAPHLLTWAAALLAQAGGVGLFVAVVRAGDARG